jgi:hypothetical protein
VGPPLASPVRLLPSYGAALAAGALSTLALLALAAGTLLTLLSRKSLWSVNFWDLVGAGEAAAWRLRFFLPIFAAALIWLSARAARKIRRAPERFAGRRVADAAFAAALAAFVLSAGLIGVTVPERLEQRRLAWEAQRQAPLNTARRALVEYFIRYKTYPAGVDDLRKLPDADGSIALALEQMSDDGYSVSAQKASLPAAQTRKLRGVRLQQIALRGDNLDDTANDRISFTNYTLRLPGEDNTLNTDDDLVMRDGVVLDRAQVSAANESAAVATPPARLPGDAPRTAPPSRRAPR